MLELHVIVKKGKNGKLYSALVADLGYRLAHLSFDRNLCAELLGLSVVDMLSEEHEYKIDIGG